MCVLNPHKDLERFCLLVKSRHGVICFQHRAKVNAGIVLVFPASPSELLTSLLFQPASTRAQCIARVACIVTKALTRAQCIARVAFIVTKALSFGAAFFSGVVALRTILFHVVSY